VCTANGVISGWRSFWQHQADKDVQQALVIPDDGLMVSNGARELAVVPFPLLTTFAAVSPQKDLADAKAIPRNITTMNEYLRKAQIVPVSPLLRLIIDNP
jgi:hypothetical protein